MTACSFHAPPGVTWDEKKPKTFRAIANWLKDRKNTIFGIDANTPEIDSPILSKMKWWYEDEGLLLGENRSHNLRDVYREYIGPAANDIKIDGPLAVSYDRGRGASIPCRYDFIFTSPEFKVLSAEYHYDALIKAGSDHTAVTAEFDF